MALDAKQVIDLLGLQPHPEGGHYGETFRDPEPEGGRGWSTAIYYLLEAGEVGRWHRVDTVEVWHWYAGDPLVLTIMAEGEARQEHVLGPDLAAGARPQVIVPAHAWQSARSQGQWTLAGCTVAPAFEFEHFELAPEGWEPSS